MTVNASKSSILKIFQGFFVSLLVLQICTATSQQPRTYPRKLHERVIAKLNQRRGGLHSGKIGTWGSWSAWTPCSRSCGTGVATQSRECRMPKVRKRIQSIEMKKGNKCVGRYKRFQRCNIQECPDGSSDFRREQCASFNRTPFNRRYYSWEPFIESPDSCILNCRAVGLSFYATLNESVVDGTPCGVFHPQLRQQNRLCVGGICMKVGCDGLLGSGRVLDSCGVCGGENSTCRLISGVYSRANLPFGYNLIATLPPGAKNLSIYHVKPSSNYLALKEVGGNYILNGPWGLNVSGGFEASGTTFTYSRPHAHGGDHLYASGPTTHSLDVMLFYQAHDPGIKYEYRLSPLPEGHAHLSTPNGGRTFRTRVPGGSVHQNSSPSGLVNDAISINAISRNVSLNKTISQSKKDKFKKERERRYRDKIKKYKQTKDKKRRRRYLWIVSGFTPCSQTCGGGTQTTRTICVKRRRKEIEAPAHFCAGLPLPREEVVRCNLRPCPAQWEANPWTPCSVTCGIGIQTRSTSCRQKVSADLTIEVPHHECRDATHIITAQVCQMRDCNGEPKWDVQSWSPCSSQCGLGTRRRNVTCTSILGVVEEHLCKDLKPIEEEMCDMGSCASDTWFFSAWDASCHGPCGEGVQKRRVHCSGDALEGKESSSCPQESKPPDTRSCSNEKECGGSWFAGPWGECDAHCGTGRQRRAVVCVTWHRGRYKVAKSAALCKAAGEKPQDTRPCAVDCRAEWFTSEWSQCSTSCDNGVQRREVKCLDQQQRPSLECSSASKPDSRQTCNTQPCKTEHLNDSAVYNNFDEHLQKLPNDSSASVDTGSASSELETKNKALQPPSKESCIDRMKNCHLVYKARLCRLKYYNKLCCETCSHY